MLEMEKYFET